MSLSLATVALIAGCGGDKGGGGSANGGGGGEGGIAVGLFTSLTGEESSWGKATKEGVELATEEFNAAGGLNGQKVSLYTEDDASTPERAKTVTESLVNEKKVVALLGEVSSGRTLVGGKVAEAAGIPLISSASTKVTLPNEIGASFNRVCYKDDFQAAVLAKYAVEKGWKKIAMFVDKKNPYSTGLQGDFDKYIKKFGGEVVATEFYNKGDQEFSSQLASIKGKGPDAVFIPGYYNEIIPISKQARNLGLNVPLFGGDGWDAPNLYDGAGDAIVGSQFSDHFTKDDPAEHVQKFVKDFAGKFGHQPDAIAALAYDSAKVLFDAMKRAGSTDKEKLKKAIRETKDYKGVTGMITIDTATGDCQKPIVILEVEKGGAFKPVKSMPWFDPSK